MTDVLVQTLLIRGPRAHRLARAAAAELPAALERALADIDDVSIDTLAVRLDFDPDECDDATIAILWAEAIRREVLASGGVASTTRTRTSSAEAAAARHPSRSRLRAADADAVAAARGWLATPAPRGAVPVAALRLAEPAIAADAIASLGATGWARLVAELDGAIRAPRARAWTDAARPEVPPAGETSGERPDAGSVRRDLPEPTGAPHISGAQLGDVRHRSAGASEEVDRAAAARIASLAELIDPDVTELDLATVTTAAGLALLYPWLADLCREAASLHPGRDAATVRALALAALVDPSDPSLIADPLVTFLAGLTEPANLCTPPLAEASAVEASCERALSSFASLLPGFATSSPTYVREQWIRRAGVLDNHRDPILLSAATHPLDVVLMRLPYPVALFALPWTAPIAVRFQP